MTVQKLIEPVVSVPCPACQFTPGLADNPTNQQGPGANGMHKRGRWKGLYRNSMPVCQLCKGRGIVYPSRICECGWPAVLYAVKQKVWCCGSENCAKYAALRRDGVRAQGVWHGGM